MTTKTCLFCHLPLNGKQRNYCSDAHRKAYERQKERITNLSPQAQNGPKADNIRIPDIDLSGLVSEFSVNELRDFAAHVLAMADYEHVWYDRALEEFAKVPGPKHITGQPSPDFLRNQRILVKYQKSEAIFRWIADRIVEAIGQKVKPYKSPFYGGYEFQMTDGKVEMMQ